MTCSKVRSLIPPGAPCPHPAASALVKEGTTRRQLCLPGTSRVAELLLSSLEPSMKAFLKPTTHGVPRTASHGTGLSGRRQDPWDVQSSFQTSKHLITVLIDRLAKDVA